MSMPSIVKRLSIAAWDQAEARGHAGYLAATTFGLPRAAAALTGIEGVPSVCGDD